MKRLLSLCFLLSSLFVVSQQTFVLNPAMVNPEDAENFEMLIKKYGKQMAEDAVNTGLIQGWALLKRVPGMGKVEDEKINYLWVVAYESPKKYVNRQSWFNTEKKYGIPGEILFGGIDVERYGSFVYKTEKRYDNNLKAKFIIFNWTYPKNINSAMNLADKISSSFQKDMKKEGMASWGMATRIIPQDSDLAPLFFWDAYENMEQVIDHLMYKAAIKNVDQNLLSQLQEELPDGWDSRIVWEFVSSTN
tara:strand:+ start:646 stop:1389 length:744 start_codon:yes stop_codon:yes gene_type:complete